MQRGITIARKGTTFDILVMPDVDFVEQRRNFRKLRAHLEGYDEVELWSSGRGRVKRYRFKPKVTAVIPSVAPAEDTTASPETPASVPSDSPAGLPPVVVESSPSPSAPKAKKARQPSGKKKADKAKK